MLYLFWQLTFLLQLLPIYLCSWFPGLYMISLVKVWEFVADFLLWKIWEILWTKNSIILNTSPLRTTAHGCAAPRLIWQESKYLLPPSLPNISILLTKANQRENQAIVFLTFYKGINGSDLKAQRAQTIRKLGFAFGWRLLKLDKYSKAKAVTCQPSFRRTAHVPDLWFSFT